MSNYSNKLYAIMNTDTGKLETKLTNPGHKFWEVKGHCINALNKYIENYWANISKSICLKKTHPDYLRVVEFKLTLNGFIEVENDET